MQKRTKIKQIKTIIDKYGSFQIGELDGLHQRPLVNSMGSVLGLIESFTPDKVEISVFHNDIEIETYWLNYEELNQETIDDILSMVEEWETSQIKTLKRIAN